MAPLYKKALIIGATSGIGEALAAKLVEKGTQVIVTGRRREKLDAFVSKHGDVHADSHVLDVTELQAIPAFAHDILSKHPDLDCVVLNSGVQRGIDFSKPETVDLGLFDEELMTNYTAAVHLVTAFLPHLQKLGKEKETHLVFISASLGLVPSFVRTPGYNASKSALHSWIMTLRQQLKDAGNNIRVVELFPPAVQTELHDTKHQPDLRNGGEIGMPLAQYTDLQYAGLEKGDEQFAIGPAQEWLDTGFEVERQKLFHQQRVVIAANLAKYVKQG